MFLSRPLAAAGVYVASFVLAMASVVLVLLLICVFLNAQLF